MILRPNCKFVLWNRCFSWCAHSFIYCSINKLWNIFLHFSRSPWREFRSSRMHLCAFLSSESFDTRQKISVSLSANYSCDSLDPKNCDPCFFLSVCYIILLVLSRFVFILGFDILCETCTFSYLKLELVTRQVRFVFCVCIRWYSMANFNFILKLPKTSPTTCEKWPRKYFGVQQRMHLLARQTNIWSQ